MILSISKFSYAITCDFVLTSHEKKLEALKLQKFSQEVAERILKYEPKLAFHIISQTPLHSPDESFLDPNSSIRHHYKTAQENPSGFDSVTLYRGLNGVELGQVSNDNTIEQNSALWVSPSSTLAGYYAAGNYRMNKDFPYGLVIKLEIPRFLVHWSLSTIDGADMTDPEIADYIYEDSDYAEAYLRSSSLVDWRIFITKAYSVFEELSKDVHPVHRRRVLELNYHEVEPKKLNEALSSWDKLRSNNK